MARMYVDPVGYLERCRRELGPVFRIDYPGSPPFAFIAEAELVRELYSRDRDIGRAGEAREPFLSPLVGANSLLCLEGERWQRHRALIAAPLHGERVIGWRDQIVAIAEAEIETWPLGEPFAVHPRMQRVTLEIMLRIVFGIEDLERLRRLRVLLPGLLEAASLVLLVPGIRRLLGRSRLRSVPGNPVGRFLAMRGEADGLLYEEIARRRAEGDSALAERSDLLSMLLLARDEDGEPLTDLELRDELMTLLAAGHDTSATALAWALERLVRHPVMVDRLRDTLAVGDDSYLAAVVKETLRVRPVVFDTPRLLTAPLELGGVRIPEGWLASSAIPSVHLTAATWEHPDRFDPDRFLAADPPISSWLPFGGGRRRCVGSRLALLELHAVLATIVERCELRHPTPRTSASAPAGSPCGPPRGPGSSSRCEGRHVERSDTALLLRLWDAFAAGDDETVLGMLAPDIRWHGAGDPSGEEGCRNREHARGFLERFRADGQSATLIDVREAGHRLVAIVQTHAPPEWPQETELHGELVTVRNGLITEILVHPTVEEALVAAGLGPDAER